MIIEWGIGGGTTTCVPFLSLCYGLTLNFQAKEGIAARLDDFNITDCDYNCSYPEFQACSVRHDGVQKCLTISTSSLKLAGVIRQSASLYYTLFKLTA